MADVQALLKNILSAVYGKDVRQSIHDAIKQCYYDGKAGGNDLEARDRAAAAEARMDTFTKLATGSTSGDAELMDIRVGIDGTKYATAGTAIREQIRDTHTIEVTSTEPTRDNTQVWINPTETKTIIVPEVIDDIVSPNDTWSSAKIMSELQKSASGIASMEVDGTTLTITTTDGLVAKVTFPDVVVDEGPHASRHGVDGDDPITIALSQVSGLVELLAGKAPAGYGLGTSASLPPDSDLNNATETGWYQVTDSVANKPNGYNYGVVEVYKRTDNNIGQIFRGVNRNSTIPVANSCNLVAMRAYHNTWGEWEWVNPPMRLDVEYRTTERYKGKPVYVEVKESDVLSVGSSSSPATTYIRDYKNHCETVVRFDARFIPVNGGPGYQNVLFDPSTGSVLGVTAVHEPNQSNLEDTYPYGWIKCFGDLSAYKCRMTLWYTKNTD